MGRILLLLDRNLKSSLAEYLSRKYQVLLLGDQKTKADRDYEEEVFASRMRGDEEVETRVLNSLTESTQSLSTPFLRELLTPSVDVSSLYSPITHLSFDLCILDEATFTQHRPQIQVRKIAEEPAFLPFLLVSDAVSNPQKPPLDFILEQLGNEVDEIIATPVRPAELHLRVKGLLERRRLSQAQNQKQDVSQVCATVENHLMALGTVRSTIISLQTANQVLQKEISERVKVEQALRENSYLDSLINSMPDIVCFKDGEGRWLEANQAMLTLFELDPARYRGLKDRELANLSEHYQDALLTCEQTDQEAWKKGGLSRGEEVIPCNDGTVKIYDVLKVPLFYADGQRKALVILGRDITEQKQAQDELVRLAAIVESSDDGIIGKSIEGNILSWNAGAERIYGYSAAEVKGHSIALLAMPDRPHELSQILANIRAGASIDHYETVHLRKDGRQIDVSLTISPIKDRTGTVVGVSTIARDISDRKQVEKALEQLRHQNELILFSAGEGICGLNRQGKITFVNPAAARMTGYKVKELIDRPLYESLHRTSGNNVEQEETSLSEKTCQILATLEDGLTRHVMDEVFWRRDGSSFPVEYVATPMQEQGEIVGAVVTFKDITERIAVERMKDEFISVVSHELRTPLTSIHGALGLLHSGILETQPQRTKRMLEIAVTNTDRLVRLVSEILDLERMESEQGAMVKQVCNLADLMFQATDEMRGMAQKAGVRLQVTPLTVLIQVIPDRLIQALTNLLSNAIKFSPAGGTVWVSGTLEKSGESAKEGGAHVLIVVKDQGRGIPQNKLEIIFERFQQVDASDSRAKGGTGLGLAICRAIMQQHSGDIWVESTLGEGSTFLMRLPIFKEGD